MEKCGLSVCKKWKKILFRKIRLNFIDPVTDIEGFKELSWVYFIKLVLRIFQTNTNVENRDCFNVLSVMIHLKDFLLFRRSVDSARLLI